MKVQIIQCRHKGFAPLGWLIRVIQRSKYSHYALGFISLAGINTVADATSKDLAPKPFMRFLHKYFIVNTYTLDVTAKREDVIRWIESYYGTPYAVLQLFGIKLKIKKWGYGEAKMTCNEFILRFLNRFSSANIKNIDILDLNQTEKEIIKVLRGQ